MADMTYSLLNRAALLPSLWCAVDCMATGAFAIAAIGAGAAGIAAHQCLVVQPAGAAPVTVMFFSGNQQRSF
ncbi:hypothetical protein H3V53_07220 [Paraburkholderia bengalensis]|uniref:Uncharacterized protein n=1 Tax=Paraburkholderia bengalensis TaxID=2747562 RepID=A0ABU8ING2_9BURK